jgi:hypothetical protein
VTSAYLAEVAADLGSGEQMTTLLRALAPYHRRFVAPGAGVAVCSGSVARHLGLLAAGLGAWSEAERYLLEAAEQDSRAGALPFAAHAQVALAEVLRRRSDHRGAAALARSAARTAETAKAVGMVTPGGFEAFFTDVGTPVRPGETSGPSPEIGAMNAAVLRQGVETLGPPPTLD